MTIHISDRANNQNIWYNNRGVWLWSTEIRLVNILVICLIQYMVLTETLGHFITILPNSSKLLASCDMLIKFCRCSSIFFSVTDSIQIYTQAIYEQYLSRIWKLHFMCLSLEICGIKFYSCPSVWPHFVSTQ